MLRPSKFNSYAFSWAGFTLLELMIVLVIVAVLMAIATPLYMTQVRESQRGAAQSQMLVIAGDIERFRARNLTYAGYSPQSGFAASGTISSATNAIIYLPLGSTSTNYKYQVALLDGNNRSQSLFNSSTGSKWVMVAQPNQSNQVLQTASRLVLDSQGVRCMTNSVITDAIMKTNIINTALGDGDLCTGTSLGW